MYVSVIVCNECNKTHINKFQLLLKGIQSVACLIQACQVALISVVHDQTNSWVETNLMSHYGRRSLFLCQRAQMDCRKSLCTSYLYPHMLN